MPAPTSEADEQRRVSRLWPEPWVNGTGVVENKNKLYVKINNQYAGVIFAKLARSRC
jgi:hypothetical protein